jgi:dihydroxyacetone kinase DhaKLM complex PTS-EIIA-like component DhaM
VDKQLHAKILRLAKKAGMEHNKFGFAAQLIQEALKQRKRRKRRRAAPPRG